MRLAKSLEDLVDSPNPQNVLKFRLVCEYEDSGDTVSRYKFKIQHHKNLKSFEMKISTLKRLINPRRTLLKLKNMKKFKEAVFFQIP